MGQIIFFCIIGSLFVFAMYMFMVTAAMGTNRLKTSQYFMSSLKYSEEATDKTNLLIDKYEAEIISAELTRNHIIFLEDNKEIGALEIDNKYFSYGNLVRYGSNKSHEFQCTKPNLKTFHRIIKLENKLIKEVALSTPVNTSKPTKADSAEVILD